MTQPELALLKYAVDEAVQREGLRAFAERTGVPLGVVRGAQRDQNLTAASISKLAQALGLDFYVGPRSARTSTAQASPSAARFAGLAEEPQIFRMTPPGRDAWAKLDRPAPAGAFFLQRDDDTVAEESGCFCLVEPEADLLVGGLVYLEDHDGRAAIGEYSGADPANGWIRVLRHGAAMTDERAPGSLRRVAAVTWSGRTPPPAVMSGFAEAPARGQAAREEIGKILAELRQRLLKAIE
jgi:hypothetical protein